MTKGPAPGQERIVVSRLRFLGDVVLSTPVLATLREARPGTWIDYLTTTPFAPALEHHPAVDRVLTLSPNAGLRRTLALARCLREPRVHWFFDLLSNPRSAVHVALARPENAVGQRAGVRSLVYDYRRPRPSGSQVRGHLDKLTPLLGRVPERRPRLHVTDDERECAARRFDLVDGRPAVVVHPGATWPWRLWPPERWRPVIRGLLEAERGLRVLVVTPPGAETLAAAATPDLKDVRVLPSMALRSLIAVLDLCRGYVGNDGGILHTAVALGLPTVGLFGGENDPEEWFPYRDMGPFEPILRASAELLPDGRGHRFPRPDADPDEVLATLLRVLEAAPA